MEMKNKEKRSWPLYAFLIIIVFLLIMILFSIYYFCSVVYTWAQYSLQQDGYFVQSETGNEIIINNNVGDNTTIISTPNVNNTVD